MNSILNHPEWTTLQWCLFLEYVSRDPRPGGDVPRFRIEVRTDLPELLTQHLLTLRSPCAACGAPMAPIRKRVHGGLYFGATCIDALHGSCSKGSAARAEYRRVHEALRVAGVLVVRVPAQRLTQPALFDLH